MNAQNDGVKQETPPDEVTREYSASKFVIDTTSVNWRQIRE
jgi:hypothetical protein